MIAAIKAYSMAVAAVSSRMNLFSIASSFPRRGRADFPRLGKSRRASTIKG
jgi:hypothetical protein